MKKILIFLFLFMIFFAGSVSAETIPDIVQTDINAIDLTTHDYIVDFDSTNNTYHLYVFDKDSSLIMWSTGGYGLNFNRNVGFHITSYDMTSGSVSSRYYSPSNLYYFYPFVQSSIDIYTDSNKTDVFFSALHIPLVAQAEQLLPVIQEQVGGIVLQAFKILSIVLVVILAGYFLRSFLP